MVHTRLPPPVGFATSISEDKIFFLGRIDEKIRDHIRCLDRSASQANGGGEYYAYDQIEFNGRNPPTVDETQVSSLRPVRKMKRLDVKGQDGS